MGQLPFVKRILLLALLIISTSAFAVESQKVDPLLYADPIPATLTRPFFDAIGLKPAQYHLFKVIRLVPLELGGTNARENLVLATRERASDKRTLDAIIIAKVRRNKMTADDAVKLLQVWKP
jgi:hypothetical protein